MFLSSRRTAIDELPEELVEPLRETDFIIRSFLAGLSFIINDARRDPGYVNNHLLSYLAQRFSPVGDFGAILGNGRNVNVAKRELRFVVESSIKICFVQQQNSQSSAKDNIEQFKKELSSERMSIKRNLNLSMLPAEMHEAFGDEIGRVYQGVRCGRSSSAVAIVLDLL